MPDFSRCSHAAITNRLQQFITHSLPVNDQTSGAAILQTTTRLGIPLGIGITTVIWSSSDPLPSDPWTNFTNSSLDSLQAPYIHVFITTLSFATVAVLLSPFTRLGKLGVPSTATDSSLPQTESGLKNINHDGPSDRYATPISRARTNLTRLPSINRESRVSQLLKIQPRISSFQSKHFSNAWKRSSAGGKSLHLPRIPGNRASGDVVAFDSTSDDDSRSQRSSTTAMTKRVIWLVCEDCGASKRIVEPVGDPGKYFYDGDDICDKEEPPMAAAVRVSATAPSAVSEYHDPKGSVDGVGVGADKRRFALVNAPMRSVMETHEE